MKKEEKENKKIPACVGVIMDGNRRWAKSRSLPSFAGHNEGYKKLKEFIIWVKEAKIKNLIVYAFSTENWKRDKLEIGMLIKLLGKMLEQSDEFKKEGIKITFIGQKERFSDKIINCIHKMEDETKDCNTIHIMIALSYGGRAEIVHAVNSLLQEGAKNISEEIFSGYLWTKGIPDPDMIIRTGGERRLSNFLSWQSVYSEMFFVDTYWPSFTKKEFEDILFKYGEIKRRKGK